MGHVLAAHELQVCNSWSQCQFASEFDECQSHLHGRVAAKNQRSMMQTPCKGGARCFCQRMPLSALTFVSACLWPRWCQFCEHSALFFFEIMSAATKQLCETIVLKCLAIYLHRLHHSSILCFCDDQPSVFFQMSTRTVRHSSVLAFGRTGANSVNALPLAARVHLSRITCVFVF